LRSIAKRTIWRYPRPRGLLGNLGFDARSGFQHVKIETFEGSRRVDKTFGYRHRAGGRWVAEKPEWADAVPYRAEELRSAVAYGGARIWVTEGEADADALVGLGEVATSSHRGAEGWTPKMAKWFFASWWPREVVVVADRDPTGAYCAARTVGLLRDVGVPIGRLRVARAAVDGFGVDTRDHLAAGYGIEDFVTLDIDEVLAYVARNASVIGTRAGGSGPMTRVSEADREKLKNWKPRRA
jgi:hypothetical protein